MKNKLFSMTAIAVFLLIIIAGCSGKHSKGDKDSNVRYDTTIKLDSANTRSPACEISVNMELAGKDNENASRINSYILSNILANCLSQSDNIPSIKDTSDVKDAGKQFATQFAKTYVETCDSTYKLNKNKNASSCNWRLEIAGSIKPDDSKKDTITYETLSSFFIGGKNVLTLHNETDIPLTTAGFAGKTKALTNSFYGYVGAFLIIVLVIAILYLWRKKMSLKRNGETDHREHVKAGARHEDDYKQLYETTRKDLEKSRKEVEDYKNKYLEAIKEQQQSGKNNKINLEKTDNNVSKEKKTKASVKMYFPRNSEDFFLKSYPSENYDCKFVAEEIKPNVFRFTIISVERIRSWDISKAVTSVGKVLQEDAHGFETKEYGIVEPREENGTRYWKITKKAEIEYLK